MAAGNAVIGALRVDLGLNSAQFQSGLKAAQSNLASFGKIAAVGFAAAATAAVAAGAAFAVMGKRAIDSADNLSKTAQKAGLTTEALSRLNYAAGYSDVALEQLSGGLQKLSKNMADVAAGSKGPAATAFAALGINVTDAAGKLRSSDEVFAQVAETFSRLEDGSTKTALAMQLFGKTGADLIPLLNTGRDGLEAMADESDRLGLTVSTKTGRAAEQFNDTLTKVGRIIEGVAMKVAEAALPALQDLADTLASPEFAAAAQAIGTRLVMAFDLVVKAIVATQTAMQGFFDWLKSMGGDASPGNGAPLINGMTPTDKYNLGQNVKASSNYPGFAESLYGGFTFGANGQMNVASPTSGGGMTIPNFTDTGAAEAMASRLEALRQSLMTEEQLEMDSHLKRLEEIKQFYADGAIARGEYDTLLQSAQEQHAERMTEIAKEQVEEETRLREGLVSNVASIFGSLSSLAESFGDKNLGIAKAFAVAEAIMNTAQGITKALAQGGIFGFAGAAAVAAAGAAQIATILSTSKGSNSKASVSSSASSAVETPAASTAGSTAVNVTLQGGGRYSREEVESLLMSINDALGDGAKLNLNAA